MDTMTNSKIFDKNVLTLFPLDENQYFNFHYEALKVYFKTISRINFAEYSLKHGIKKTESFIRNFVITNRIDMVISFPFATNFELSVEYYYSLRDIAKLIFWMFDDENYFNSYSKYYCQAADAVITTDYFSTHAYANLGIPPVLYFSSYPRENYHPAGIERDIDVCFLGNCRKNDRMEYIDYLLKNGVNIQTFGTGSTNGFVEWKDFSKIFSRSKINLNFTKLDKLGWVNRDEPLLNRVRQNKGRPIEISMTKSFCLSEYSPAIGFLFEIDKEIDVFDSKEELLRKVRYYLENDSKREEMASNAHERAIKNYSSDIYIPRVLNAVKNILQKPVPTRHVIPHVFLSTAFKIKYINGTTLTFFQLLKRGKILLSFGLIRKLFDYGFFIFLLGFFGGAVRTFQIGYAKINQYDN